MGTLEKKALKQYRRVCDSCQETFRPYKDITTCLNCLTARYSEVWERRVLLPGDYEKAQGVTEVMQGACVWLLWLFLVSSVGAGQAYAQGEISKVYKGEATFYGTEACAHNPSPSCPTASGVSLKELIRKDVPYAATWKYPMGSSVEVCRSDDPRRCVTARIFDRGPNKRFRPERIIDLREREFRALVKPGESNLRVVMRRIA